VNRPRASAQADFFQRTGWEPDYLTRRGQQTSIAGYRGPLPTGNEQVEAASAAFAPLFSTSNPAQLRAVLGMAVNADRVLVAWQSQGAIGLAVAHHVDVEADVDLERVTGWHLTMLTVAPGFRGKGLLPDLVQMLVREEPVDFVSAITNDENVYRAIASSCPGGVAYPNRAGRHDRRIPPIAEQVIAQLPGASALPSPGPDLTWRGLLASATPPADNARSTETEVDDSGSGPAGARRVPTAPADGRSRFRASLRLTSADTAFVLGDLSGVIGAPARATAGLMAVPVAHRLRNVTVTGTNGKTSTVEYGRQLSQAAGLEAASFGTLGTITARGRTRRPRMGTGRRAMPEYADRMWALGHDVLWSEGYSYALSRALFDHLPVDVAAFTQFGFDHQGMHGSLAGYWAAKERLFRAIVRPEGTVVLDPGADGADRILAIAEQRGLRVITTGANNEVEIGPSQLRVGDQTFACTVPVTESVMIANLELAVAAGLALGLEPPDLAAGIGSLAGPPGRFEELDLGTPFRLVIDSAHNGDALEAALGHWRERTEGRLLVVVASVGSADASRWEPIGEVAHVMADVVVVTDESPHRGDAERIRAAILRGCPRGIDIADRRAAVERVVAEARPGDTVLVTGRADEDFLVDEHGTFTYPTDTELLTAAVARMGRAGAS
jgi:UDP-N-acetylmuramoyl-L-alanyl-D-glutamate--2,6-diaminopimelate ligase